MAGACFATPESLADVPPGAISLFYIFGTPAAVAFHQTSRSAGENPSSMYFMIPVVHVFEGTTFLELPCRAREAVYGEQ